MARTTRRHDQSGSVIGRIFLSISIFLILATGNAFAQVDEYLVMNNPKIKSTSYQIGNITVGDPNIVNFKADRKKKPHYPLPQKSRIHIPDHF
jgi:hypothetical protein